MKSSDLIARFLAAQGVTHVYEMIGGMITHMVDSLAQVGGIKIVCMHHEQGAAFAIDGHARMTGTPMVAMATSGPGATNLLTGIGSCYFDSVPAVFITGQVNRHEMKGDRAIRQLGFQETDIVTMARPVTKGAWQVLDPENLYQDLVRAFSLARSGRPGPVLIDIPMDVQRADLAAWPDTLIAAEPLKEPGAGETAAVWERMAKAKKPLILVGGGMRSANAADEFRQVLTHVRIPVINSLMGVDVLPYGHPSRVGMIGSYGNRWANHAMGSADVMMVLGSRLDIRQTGADTKSFSEGRTIIHVDCDAGEMNNRIKDCVTILSDLKPFLRASLAHLGRSTLTAPQAWTDQIAALRSQYPDFLELRGIRGINPNTFMHEVCAGAASASAIVTDVGQHQMWAAQSCRLTGDQRFITCGGMGSMGFGLPAAIGVAFATPGRSVLVIAGDGGFQCNVQELQTIVRNRLPIKIVVLDNGCHGMVRQFQESYFEGRYQSTMFGYDAPDFAAVAAAYGVESMTLASSEDAPEALRWLWQDDRPALLAVKIDSMTNVYPKLAFGKPITEMEPLAKPLDMEGT